MSFIQKVPDLLGVAVVTHDFDGAFYIAENHTIFCNKNIYDKVNKAVVLESNSRDIVN